MERENDEKAQLIYDAIDATDFYRGHADADCRSTMNVTFRLPSEDLEKKFTSEATAQKLDGLKGHRSVGGIRSEEHTSELQSQSNLVCRLLLEKKKKNE